MSLYRQFATEELERQFDNLNHVCWECHARRHGAGPTWDSQGDFEAWEGQWREAGRRRGLIQQELARRGITVSTERPRQAA